MRSQGRLTRQARAAGWILRQALRRAAILPLVATAVLARAAGVVALAGLAACGESDREAVPHHSPAHAASTASSANTRNPAEVALAPEQIESIGVRTEPVVFGPLSAEIRGSGAVEPDQRQIAELYAPVNGWIEKLSARAVGERVKAGQLLFEIYSPTLAVVDEQYLQSLKAGNDRWDNPFARGLRSVGLTEELIAALADKQRGIGRIPFRAASAGIVLALSTRQGALVNQGASLMQVAPIDPMWVVVNVPAAQASLLAPGAPAKLTVLADPGTMREATVDHIYPIAEATTGAARVRLVVPNRDGALMPNLIVSAEISGAQSGAVVSVPLEAVIRGGREDRVVVALGEGKFAPRRVKLGRESGARVAVLEGLQQGENVVTRGIFLIDSESSLNASLARLGTDSAPPPHHHEHSGTQDR
jgi:membrane fusion protein, copper/silver efflux system